MLCINLYNKKNPYTFCLIVTNGIDTVQFGPKLYAVWNQAESNWMQKSQIETKFSNKETKLIGLVWFEVGPMIPSLLSNSKI